ncbi:MAG: hypothetical protein ACRDRO_29465 [Pseudonocardiaceae bacterium]
MRTTLNLPDALVAQAKAHAAASGQTLTSLIEEGLRLVLQQHDIPYPAAPELLPAYGHPAGRILVDLGDRDAVWTALDEDRHA